MDACPVCNAPFKNKPVCHRCKTDLARLIDIEHQAHHGLGVCDEKAAKGDYNAMLDAAIRARFLIRNPETDKKLAFAALLNGQFDLSFRLFKLSTEKNHE